MTRDYNYDLLTNKIKELTKNDSEIVKGIYKEIDKLSINLNSNKSDILFITMKEFIIEYGSLRKFTDQNIGNKVLQYFHYLSNLKDNEVIEMLNVLELTRQ